MAKLSDRQKANILAKWNTGTFTKVSLAKQFNVTEKAIRNVISGRNKPIKRPRDFLSKHGYLYIIRAGGSSNFKIGIARKSVEDRLLSLQTGNPMKLIIIFYAIFENVLELEKYIHHKYKNDRLEGEWFNLTDNQIMEIIKEELS